MADDWRDRLHSSDPEQRVFALRIANDREWRGPQELAALIAYRDERRDRARLASLESQLAEANAMLEELKTEREALRGRIVAIVEPLERLAKEGTPGPWEMLPNKALVAQDGDGRRALVGRLQLCTAEDAAYIFAATQAAPALVAAAKEGQ